MAFYSEEQTSYAKCTWWHFTKTPKIYIYGKKLAPFGGVGGQVRENLRGVISPERPEVHILSYKLAYFCGCRVKVRLNLRFGIIPERLKMYIYIVNNLHPFEELEWKSG